MAEEQRDGISVFAFAAFLRAHSNYSEFTELLDNSNTLGRQMWWIP